ncbi:hypothetical protein [Rhizobium lentis]|uniref:Uncharacterized protein n=1 Tax=Rhizobium lentis TaxID=1138194 RepID=A0A7W8UMB7_9HYPH|nr:hypothetical protein [Rhizobium lentis]MBB4574413.1 hypothetical protein [Rhizobium lentis]MBB5550339.1 hypothetical protein [Rhizobium lentis]MBB5560632.1 hypothetical protein [Rhizobium lentis]MBB5567217.1 hypothetical protein [Rhizobium lentis]
MTTDFSPAMLKQFLALRVAMMVRLDFPSQRRNGEKAALADLRKRSGLTRDEFELACKGRLKGGVARAKIWAALWIDPASLGIRLTDDGGQEGGDAA